MVNSNHALKNALCLQITSIFSSVLGVTCEAFEFTRTKTHTTQQANLHEKEWSSREGLGLTTGCVSLIWSLKSVLTYLFFCVLCWSFRLLLCKYRTLYLYQASVVYKYSSVCCHFYEYEYEPCCTNGNYIFSHKRNLKRCLKALLKNI